MIRQVNNQSLREFRLLLLVRRPLFLSSISPEIRDNLICLDQIFVTNNAFLMEEGSASVLTSYVIRCAMIPSEVLMPFIPAVNWSHHQRKVLLMQPDPGRGTWQDAIKFLYCAEPKIHQREKVHRPSCHSFFNSIMAGLMIFSSCSPRAPCLLHGLRPSTAMVGLSMAKSMRRLSSKTFIFFSEPFLWLFEQSPLIVAGGWWPNLHAIDHSPWAWGHWCQRVSKCSVWPACENRQFHRRLVDGCGYQTVDQTVFQIKCRFSIAILA